MLRIGLDHDAEPESGYAAAALRETVASIAKSRGGLLLPAENGDFVVTLCGDLPDQTQEISDDFREAVSDLALSGTNGLITVSVGLFYRPSGGRVSSRALTSNAPRKCSNRPATAAAIEWSRKRSSP